MADDTLMDALKAAQEAMKPFWDERRAIYAEKSPPLLAELSRMGVSIDTIGGNCPVQAEGKIGGRTDFYFRARGEHWQMHIGHKRDWFTGREWLHEEGYGAWPDAGWMHDHEALEFIIKAVKLYKASRHKPKSKHPHSRHERSA